MAKIPLVDLKAQFDTIEGEIREALDRVLENTSFIGGDELTTLEENFAKFQGTKHAVGVASGTAAIFLTLKALGIGEGDEIITTPHTFIATVEPIEVVGARTVMVDIDPVTYNIDPAAIEAAITPRTKVIMPVHLYGQLAPMPQIMEIAEKHGLYVVEDAAQAHGAELDGKRAGAWGIAAGFSFYPGKNLGAYGDGGAICTNDDMLAAKVAKLRDHGRTSKYVHDEIGYGERLDSLQAAILDVKLRHLDSWNAGRRKVAARYNELLADVPGVHTPQVMAGAEHIYHIYCIRVEGDRDAIKDKLNTSGVGAGIHYPVPVHMQPAMKHYGLEKGAFPITEAAAESIISLPVYAEMTDDQIEQVAAAVKQVMTQVAV